MHRDILSFLSHQDIAEILSDPPEGQSIRCASVRSSLSTTSSDKSELRSDACSDWPVMTSGGADTGASTGADAGAAPEMPAADSEMVGCSALGPALSPSVRNSSDMSEQMLEHCAGLTCWRERRGSTLTAGRDLWRILSRRSVLLFADA